MPVPIKLLPPGVIKVPPPSASPPAQAAPPGAPGGVIVPKPTTPGTPGIEPQPVPDPAAPGGSIDTPLGEVPVQGDPSTTGGLSWADALTYSSGSPVIDAAAGGVAGALVSPDPGLRLGYALAGGLATGLLGAMGLVGVVGIGLGMRLLRWRAGAGRSSAAPAAGTDT